MVSLSAAHHDNHVLVTVTPPASGPRARKHVCALVDVSYSMNDAANAKGDELVRWFSKLDIVVHGLKALISGMQEEDVFTLVQFSTDCSVVLPATRMTAEGRAAASAAASRLRPGGGTFLWNGIKLALDQLRERFGSREEPVLLLLTDGEPSASPAAGEVQEYVGYVGSCTDAPPPTLLALGFGYDVKSDLLKRLADAAGGASMFAFVPDGTMNATVFNCALANLDVAAACGLELEAHGPAFQNVRN